jgi:hypothetical protein
MEHRFKWVEMALNSDFVLIHLILTKDEKLLA